SFSGAMDGLSGIDGFSYVWDQTSGTVPDTVKDAGGTTTTATSPALVDGSWYFHLRTVDGAGNWSDPVQLGPFRTDTRAATGAAATGNPKFTKATGFTVGWSGSDGGSGLASYDVRYRAATSTGPFGSSVGWQTQTSATSASFSGVAGSTYCFTVGA